MVVVILERHWDETSRFYIIFYSISRCENDNFLVRSIKYIYVLCISIVQSIENKGKKGLKSDSLSAHEMASLLRHWCITGMVLFKHFLHPGMSPINIILVSNLLILLKFLPKKIETKFLHIEYIITSLSFINLNFLEHN